MSYDPSIHHRRSIRLKEYDYSQAGLYFVTICCQNRIHRFGKIENDEMILNEYGMIGYEEWLKLSERFTNFELDVFQIMPNHLHGIIMLTNTVGAGFTPAQNASPPNADTQNEILIDDIRAGVNPAQNADSQNEILIDDIGAGVNPAPTNITVGNMVGAYKSLVANKCLDIFKLKWADVNPIPQMGKLWQRNYYEHIIRNEQSYHTISNYIINNPSKWNDDKFFTK